MIGHLRGILIEKQAPYLLIEVAGVGYELQAPISTFFNLPDLGKEVSLYTHFVVREDSQALYGFANRKERSLFRTLIKISGIGPKVALNVLSGIDPDHFVRCVLDGDISSLISMPGIGKKTAQRLLVEMRDRLKDWGIGTSSEGAELGGAGDAAQDAISALIALGYKPHDASRIIAKYKNENMSSEELIKTALRDLAK